MQLQRRLSELQLTEQPISPLKKFKPNFQLSKQLIFPICFRFKFRSDQNEECQTIKEMGILRYKEKKINERLNSDVHDFQEKK